MTDYQTVLTEKRGKVGIVRMNRPDQLNALNDLLVEEVVCALKAFDADDTIGCIIITGNEKCFTAGADLKEILSLEFEDAYRRDFASTLDQIALVRKPIIAAVSGLAYGGGTEVALMCDIVFAAEDARFGLPEITLGVIPGAGGTQRLTDRIGKARAMYYLLSGRPITAVEAERMGMITKIFSPEDLLGEALALANELADGPRLAMLAAKEAINENAEKALAEGLRSERRLFLSLFGTADQKEGMAAFADRRAARFTQY